MTEKTFVMLKPDAVTRGLAGEIIARIERKGFRIREIGMMHLSEETLRAHYAHIAEEPFFPKLFDYMMSGPVIAMIIEGENAVKGVRILMGATKFEEAVAGTIRGDFATGTTQNIIHGSDSPESAQTEIRRFFGCEVR